MPVLLPVSMAVPPPVTVRMPLLLPVTESDVSLTQRRAVVVVLYSPMAPGGTQLSHTPPAQKICDTCRHLPTIFLTPTRPGHQPEMALGAEGVYLSCTGGSTMKDGWISKW